MDPSGILGEELCANLRDIAQAQLGALEEGDIGRFLVLAGERGDFQKRVLQPALDRVPLAAAPKGLAGVLREVARLDGIMSEHLMQMLEETSEELRDLRQGRIVVNAYGKPGMTLYRSGGLLDQSR
jgi:hypothetical protein